jgi:hypothetical protein
VYCHKNLEQRINMQFCVEFGKTASGRLALLTLACGEFAMKKWSVFEWLSRSKEEREMCSQFKVMFQFQVDTSL